MGTVPEITAPLDSSVVTVELYDKQSVEPSEGHKEEPSEQQVPIVHPPGFFDSWSKYYSQTFPGDLERLTSLVGNKGFVEAFDRVVQGAEDKLLDSGSDTARRVRQGYISNLAGICKVLKDGQYNGAPDDPQAENALLIFKGLTDAMNDQIAELLRSPAGEGFNYTPFCFLSALGVVLAGLFDEYDYYRYYI
jgi:hypothetical protein